MVAIKDIEMPKSCGGCNCSVTGVCKEWVYLNGYDLGRKRADNCPLVEIEERKVGKWIVTDSYHWYGINEKIQTVDLECSCCQGWLEWETEELEVDRKPKYCPYCGAELREVINAK